MFRFDENAMVTIAPDFPAPACGATRFRWAMHVALPYPLPLKQCVHQIAPTSKGDFRFGVHAHLDRVIRIPTIKGAIPQVFLRKGLPFPAHTHNSETAFTEHRELLQSVAVFEECTEHPNPKDAFHDAATKVNVCFSFLTDFLLSIQKSMPYMASWMIYPISMFDVGTAHHSVEHFCPNGDRWTLVGSGLTINLAVR